MGKQTFYLNGEDIFAKIEKLEQENKKLKKRCEEWALETVKMQGAIDGEGFRIDKYKQALKEIRNLIQVFVPEEEADYNSAKKTHPVFFGLLEQIKYHCNEVLNDRD